MGKTLEVASDRAYDDTKIVLPAEVARGVIIRNIPGLQGLKLMHLLIGTAGGRMADDVRHELRLADIRNIDGMQHHDRASIQKLFEELSGMVMIYDNQQTMLTTMGGLLDHTVINYRNEVNGEVLVSWYFGRMFREMAAVSSHWAILDRQTVFHLGSKFSVLLFQHIASLVNLNRVASKSFTVSELRAVLGVPEGKLERFSNFKAVALMPAISEINQLSRFTLTATPKKIGRTVESVIISWEVKPDQSRTKRELSSARVGRKARRDGTEEKIIEAFPASGAIYFGGGEYTGWAKVARDNLPEPRPDINLVADKFRRFASSRKINLAAHDIEQKFATFCQKEWL